MRNHQHRQPGYRCHCHVKHRDHETYLRIMLLLEKDQQTLNRTLVIGLPRTLKGNPFSSIKGRIIFWRTMILVKRSSPDTMTFYPLDILVKLKPLMLSKSIIGGLECRLSSRTMSKDVAYASNSRSTGIPQHLPSIWYLDWQKHDCLWTYLWI